MARYRKIDTRIWNDEKFRAFSDDAQLAFFFVLTHPSMTALGAMRGTIAGLAAEKGWQVGRFADAIRDAIREGMLEVNERACFIAARNFLRYNEPEGPNSVAKAWVEALDLIPECPEKRALIARCRTYLDTRSKKFRDAMPDGIWNVFKDAMLDAKSDASPIQEPEQEQEQEQEEDSCIATSATPPGANVIALPLNNGTDYQITWAVIQEWIGLYPAVDVEQELRNMRGWLLANKNNRKTRSGILRFATGWLAKEQNKAPRSAGFDGSDGLSKTQQRIQRNREVLVAAAFGDAASGMRGRPSDAQFVGETPQFPPCPLSECDGGGWYIERGTRKRIECRCAQTRKASAPETKPAIDAAS